MLGPDGIVYLEVPLDRFRVSRYHASERYQRYLGKVSQRNSFVALDFASGLSRQIRSSIPRFGVVKQSEHINYFSPRAVEAALAITGFTPVAQRSNPNMKVGGLRLGCYGVAARPRTPPPSGSDPCHRRCTCDLPVDRALGRGRLRPAAAGDLSREAILVQTAS